MYRVSKSPVTKTKSFLYVVPTSLKAIVLKGVHDEAGHQGLVSEDERDLSCSSASDYPHTMAVDVVMDDDMSTDAVEYRTKVWLSQLPSEGSSDQSVEVYNHCHDVLHETHLEPSLAQSHDGGSDQPSCPDDPLPSPVSVGLQSQNPRTPVSELCDVGSDQSDGSCLALADVAESSDHVPTLFDAAVPVPPVEALGGIRSRVGRLFKPVVRLIEMMDQKIKAN